MGRPPRGTSVARAAGGGARAAGGGAGKRREGQVQGRAWAHLADTERRVGGAAAPVRGGLIHPVALQRGAPARRAPPEHPHRGAVPELLRVGRVAVAAGRHAGRACPARRAGRPAAVAGQPPPLQQGAGRGGRGCSCGCASWRTMHPGRKKALCQGFCGGPHLQDALAALQCGRDHVATAPLEGAAVQP